MKLHEFGILTLAVILATSIGGCASIDVTPISGHSDAKTHGIRFYEPHPYLLVTLGATSSTQSAGTPGVKPAGPSFTLTAPAAADKPANVYTATIIYLPDYSRGYAINVNSGIGTSDETITLVDGWQLTALNSKLDSKVPETITAITGLIPALAKAIGVPGVPNPADAGIVPGLYRFNFDEKTGRFVDLELVRAFSEPK